MKTFTKEEIVTRRKYFEEQGFKEVHTVLGNLNFNYFVLPQSLNETLPNFAFRMIGNNKEDGELYGISDSVSEDFRQYAVAHEVIEFREIGINQKGRCLQAFEKELSFIPQEDMREYVPMRRNFFRDLVDYAIVNHYSHNDRDEFSKSLLRLERLIFVSTFQDLLQKNMKRKRDHHVLLTYLEVRDAFLKDYHVGPEESYAFLKKEKDNRWFHESIFLSFENKIMDTLEPLFKKTLV